MNRRKLVVVCAGLAVIAVVTVALAAVRQPAPAADVKGDVAAITNQNVGDQAGNAPAQTASTADVATAKPVANNTQKPSNTTAPAASQPAAPAQQPASKPKPAPQPNPSFSIILRDDEAYIYTYPPEMEIEQLIVPFDVVYDAGFVPNTFDMPDCQFLVAPTTDHNVLCNVSEKDRGYLGLQYSDASAPGHYKVRVTYTVNGVTRTDTTEFDLE